MTAPAMIAPNPPLVFAPTESRELGLAVCREAGLELAPLEERSFEEGEFKLRPLVSVRERRVFVVQTLAGSPGASVANRVLRLLFLLFGLRDAGAAHTIAVVPYLTFARKDRRTHPRDPVNSRYIAQLLEATGLAQMIVLDVHNPAALDNAFRVPVDHLSAIPMFVEHFARTCAAEQILVASPDIGGVKRAQIFGEALARRLGREIGLAFIEKRRTGGLVSTGRVVGEVRGRTVIVLDDLCASGGTLIRAATALREAGALAVHVAFTHAPLPRGLAALATCDAITEVVLTDSAGTDIQGASLSAQMKRQVLPVAPLLGRALARMLAGAPLAPLLDHWPLRDGE